MSGNFSITVGNTTLTFPHDVTAEQLKNLMTVQLPDEGGENENVMYNNISCIYIHGDYNACTFQEPCDCNVIASI